MEARSVPGVPGTAVDSLPPPHAAPQEGWTDVQVTMAGDGGGPAMGLGHQGGETTSQPPSLHPPIEVLACQQYQILPRMAEFIQVTLTPDVWNKEKEFLADQMLGDHGCLECVLCVAMCWVRFPLVMGPNA